MLGFTMEKIGFGRETMVDNCEQNQILSNENVFLPKKGYIIEHQRLRFKQQNVWFNQKMLVPKQQNWGLGLPNFGTTTLVHPRIPWALGSRQNWPLGGFDGLWLSDSHMKKSCDKLGLITSPMQTPTEMVGNRRQPLVHVPGIGSGAKPIETNRPRIVDQTSENQTRR